MKKRVLVTVLGALMVSGLCTGCGSSTENEQTSSKVVSETNASNETDSKNPVLENDTTENETVSKEITAETVFPKSADWDNVPQSYQPIQIGDFVIYPGMSVEEAMSKIEASAVKWQYEYNPDKIEMSGSSDQIEIYSEDGSKLWFTLYTKNPSSENGSFKDNIVGIITTNDDIIPYCRLIDGSSYDDFIGMSYEDAKNLAATAFSGIGASYSEETGHYNGSKEKYIIIKYMDNNEYPAYATEKGYSLYSVEAYVLFVDPNTGKVIAMERFAGRHFTLERLNQE